MQLSHLLFASILGLTITLPVAAATDTPTQPTTIVQDSTKKKPIVIAGHETKETATKIIDTVNINTADAQQIKTVLKMIGKKRAEAIVEYRNQHGPFQSIDDLTKVKGISKQVVEKNKDKILLK